MTGPRRSGAWGFFLPEGQSLNSESKSSRCPHCGEILQAFELPPNSDWQTDFQLACFNDECPYYVRGWEWMESQYAVKASYRFRLDPGTGHASPLAVWSPTAVKDRIIDISIPTDDREEATEA
jgi:hypothetical protein